MIARHSRSLSRLALALAAVVAWAPGAFAATVAVKISDFAFDPPVLTVAPGTTVTWTNEDETPHSVVQDDKAFRSGALDTDDSYSFTFAAPGVYRYYCSLHPHMTGTITVGTNPDRK